MALSAATVWECRQTGNDGNGGGFVAGASGTDYSQQDTAHSSRTDLVIGASANLLTSAADPFDADDVGNIINITSGTGFTVGRYQIVSVDGSNIATLDRNCGTISSTGGNGALGGALASPGIAAANQVTGNIIWCKGTFTISSNTQNIANGNVNLAAVALIGYGTARGDTGKATLNATHTGANPIVRASSTAGLVRQIRVQTTTATGSGIRLALGCLALDCESDGFDSGTNDRGFDQDAGSLCINCYAVNCDVGFAHSAYGCVAEDCVLGFGAIANTFLSRCIAITCTTGYNTGDINNTVASHCVAYGCGAGFLKTGSGAGNRFLNCIAAGSSGVGFETLGGAGTLNSNAYLIGCAGYNNTGGDKTGTWLADIGFVALTVDPFVNAAGGDFSLNETANGGPELYDSAYPGTLPGTITPNNTPIGAGGPQNFGVRAAGGLMYPLGRKKIFDGEVDLLDHDIKIALVLDTYTFNPAHEFLSDVDVATNGISGNLAGKSTTGGVFDADDPTVTPDATQDINAIVVFRDTGGGASTNPLIAYLNSFTPFSTIGTDVPVIFSDGADKIFAMTDQVEA